MKFLVFVALSFSLSASAMPRYVPRSSFALQNGQDAIALNQQFASLTPNSPCTTGEDACVNSQFAQCVNGKFVLQACASTLVCAALPLVNSAGTSITCTTPSDRDARIAATGATSASSSASAASSSSASAPAASSSAKGSNNSGNGSTAGNNSNSDAQSSLTLLSSVIATGFENNGQDQPTAGQVASLTSSNNFINFCATVPQLPITNGQQVKSGSCNPAPMGMIPATTNMPSSKFVSPKNMDTIPANTNFTIQMSISNLDTGFFVNADENYFSAPQQLGKTGNIQGHSHVVIEKLSSISQTTATDPTVFAFFKGLNDAAQNGVLTATVSGGLPAGAYRLASINTAANHQPALAPVAQHGALDDMVYFTVQ
ncbi:hypothetical protein OBBRIDRAFT_418554 [Obba rivulosa]|uniref:Carbohydrate-binding module family 19 domain-containing protein n=1 Tax=Obba rivulosa TaxID=1052685 RepID=A0A8E2DMF5_9APHY|nr:hypothetical protein OBBRIDRAFT_418554 [Obba rivulosa]